MTQSRSLCSYLLSNKSFLLKVYSCTKTAESAFIIFTLSLYLVITESFLGYLELLIPVLTSYVNGEIDANFSTTTWFSDGLPLLLTVACYWLGLITVMFGDNHLFPTLILSDEFNSVLEGEAFYALLTGTLIFYN